jgi:hypothetical protein
LDSTAISKIARVQALTPQTLQVTFDDGEVVRVDLSAVIAAHPALAGLNHEAAFAQVQVSELGWGVEWPGEIDVGAPQLRRWADEQAGRVMPLTQFRDWMARHDLTLDRAAEALGLSRRMVAYDASGEKPIPKTVWLDRFQKKWSPVFRPKAVSTLDPARLAVTPHGSVYFESALATEGFDARAGA